MYETYHFVGTACDGAFSDQADIPAAAELGRIASCYYTGS
jgi:hypothetical protein